ncbi:Smr/MutS family protein [Treponema sp. SP13]|uniref:Smr/MutS family protein n=1 Tax=Treponema sp. SP13 TaxID=2789742 RepID=UPI003D8DA71C
MDFGAVLDEWDRLQKESKRKVCGGNPVSGKKANAPEKSKTPSNYSEAGNGFAKRIDPQEAWLRRYGVVDKDKIAAEEAERDRERSQRYVKDMPIEARIDLHGLTQDEARSRLVVFVGDCAKRGLRKILIVHGKGIHTTGSESVLGEVVRKFIEQDKRCGRSGHPDRRMGGSGATWVCLKN